MSTAPSLALDRAWLVTTGALHRLRGLATSPVDDARAARTWAALSLEDRESLEADGVALLLERGAVERDAGGALALRDPDFAHTLEIRRTPDVFLVVLPVGLDGLVLFVRDEAVDAAGSRTVLELPAPGGTELQLRSHDEAVLLVAGLLAEAESTHLIFVRRGDPPLHAEARLTAELEDGWIWSYKGGDRAIRDVEVIPELLTSVLLPPPAAQPPSQPAISPWAPRA